MPRLPSSASSRSSSSARKPFHSPVPHLNTPSMLESDDSDAAIAAARTTRRAPKHDHDPHASPYNRDCGAPTVAASIAFLCAFFGALMAVSLPTHVTGYFLEDLIPTILIYVCVGAGFIYSGLAVTTFFGTLEEAVNEQYRSGEFKKKTKLDVVHLLLPVSLLVIIGSSAGLYVFGLKHTHEEWNAWCTEHSLIVTGELEGDKASHAAALLVSCNDLFLNQQYMIIAAPCILTLLEIARFIKVRGFLQHLRTPAEVFVPQSLAALGKSEERRRRRRSERRRARREEEEDEKALLSV